MTENVINRMMEMGEQSRFPSRKAQFCTEELKRNMAVAYQLQLIDKGLHAVSWQGIRRDESPNRRYAKK